MIRLALIAGLLLPIPALAQAPQRVGPLVIQNALGEIASNGTQPTARANLGLTLGTSGATVPLLSGANTWSGAQTFSGTVSGAGITALLAPYAPLASPVFTGTVNGAAAAFAGNATIGGTLGVTGAATLSAGATLGSSAFSGVELGINGAVSQTRSFRWQTAGINRFQVNMSTDAEAGSNVGGNLQFGGFSDAGANLGNNITFNRASSGITQAASVVLASNTVNNAVASGILANQTFSGISAVTNGAVLNAINITDNVNWTGSSNGVTGSLVQQNYGGAATVGGRTAFWAILNQTAATSDLADNFYVGGTFQGIVGFNNGGTGVTGATAKGRVFGANPTVHLRSGATNYYQATGMEIDAAIDTGASAAIKVSLAVASLGPLNTVQGSVVDAGIWFYKSNGAPIKNAILIGGGGLNNYPIDPAGAYIADDTSGSTTASAAYGLHFVGAFTTASISVPGFVVDGTGIVSATAYKTGATAGVTCASVTAASVTVANGLVTHC